MSIKITDYAKRLGIEIPSEKATPATVDIEAGKAGYEQYLADYAHLAEEDARYAELKSKENPIMFAGMDWNLSPTTADDLELLELTRKRTDDAWRPTDSWSDDERWEFGEIYAQDKNAAHDYGTKINNEYKKKKKQAESERLSDWAKKNWVNAALATWGGNALNFVGGIMDSVDYLTEAFKKDGIPQDDYLNMTETANALHGGVSEKLNDTVGTLNEDIPIVGGAGLGDLYGVANSIGQSFLAGITGPVGMASQFGLGMANGVNDALARGNSTGQAMTYGTICGVVEMIAEMISIKKVFGMTSAESVENLFKNVLKQAGQEAGEEGLTSVLTELSDYVVNGDKSAYQLRVSELVASGMSVEEAETVAFKETLEGIAYDTIAGGISGGVMGGGATTINRVNQQFGMNDANNAAYKTLSPYQQEMITEAKKHSETEKRAAKYEKKVSGGKELSGFELRTLASELSKAQHNVDVDAVRYAIVEQMKAEGLNNTQAKVLGEIALNKAIGNDISKVQEVMLKRNEAAMKVYNQISADVMASDVADSDWARNTPIESLRAEKAAEKAVAEQNANVATPEGEVASAIKFNSRNIKGKFTTVDGKIVYKKSENSRLHTEGITSSLTREDVIELSAIEKIANALGIDIHVYETTVDDKGQRTYTDKDGNTTSDSGYYDPNNNSIHIDLHAGNNGEGTMLYTASHEVVHSIKENASEHFAALEELVTKELVKGGFSIEKLIEKQKNILKQNGWKGNEANFEEVAREEMVAEACQSFLASKNAVAEIQALKSENKGLWNTLKRFFTSLFTKINKLYKETPPDTPEAKYIADMHKAVKTIRDAFMEGAVEAAKKNAASGSKTEAKTTENKAVKSQARVTSEHDTAYLDAVKRGDMETAQKLVDEAAKANGYTVKGYHATNAEFNVFDISKTSDINYHGRGIYFTNSKRDVENNYENYEGPDPWQKIEAAAYELLYDKYNLSYEDTLTSDSEIIDKLNECYDEVIDKFKKTLRRVTAYLKFDNPLIIGKGNRASDYDLSKYDGIIDKHVYENIGHGGMDENTVHYVVLNPSNIKSADPVTYDDNGDIIPLSERFNENNKDIRHKARKKVDSYSEKEYNSFGWVRANEVLATDEYHNFTSEFSKAKTSKEYAEYKSDLDEYMISVGAMHGDKEGVKNKIVFAKGTMANPEITRIIEIDADNETFLSDEREYIYALEKQGIRTEADELFKVHTSINARSASSGKRSSNENAPNNNQLGADRGTGSGTAQKTESGIPENLPQYAVAQKFKDISGVTRNVRRLNGQFMVEGTKRKNYLFDSIEAAINAENESLISRYAKKNERSISWVKSKIAADPEFLYNKIRHKSRSTVTSAPYISPTATSIVTDIDSEYKYTLPDKALSAVIASQIAFTNAQAGIEHIGGKKYGIKNIESLVQAARASKNQAEEMIGGNQYRIGADTKEYLGEGLQKIMQPILAKSKEEQHAFLDYLFHQHNADRMSLERRSIEWNEEKKAQLAEVRKRRTELQKELMRLMRERAKFARKKAFAEKREQLDLQLKEVKSEIRAIEKQEKKLDTEISSFTPLKNKPVIALNREAVEANKRDINEKIKALIEEKKALGRGKSNAARVQDIGKEIAELTNERNSLTAEVAEDKSREIIDEYEANYPEFIVIADKIWNYNKNLNQYRADTGLIDQSQFDYMQKLYPHYVPTYRADSKTGIAAVKGKNNLAVNQSIRGATGSTKDLLNPIVIMARQTMETVRAGRVNQIANALYDGAKGDKTYLSEISKRKMKSDDLVDLDPTELRPKGNQVTFFKNGEKIVLQVSSELFAGFDAFTPSMESSNPIATVAAASMNIFKRLVTSANPAFLVRNGIRDIQDAGINSKYGVEFAKCYVQAPGYIKRNSAEWQLFRAMGGVNSDYFDFDKGFQKKQTKAGFSISTKDTNAGKTKKTYEGAREVIQRIENANNYIETLPRFAEFLASLQAGNTAEQAILDAADVTTNFARTGKVTKVLNRYCIPFLNPSIQGASKAYRNVADTFKSGDAMTITKEFSKLAFKATVVGVLPMLLNALMYRDDEDYEELRETDKENNFLIKIGDTFIKLPRGRMASVIAGAFNRAVFEEEFDLKGYLKNVSTQMSPVESMSRTIFSPFADVKNNVTWYGSAIEGKQFENLSPSQRYDESTSSIAIAMAKVLNKFGAETSPKKIHYLLDQYSGVIGDFILPATSKKAEKDFLSGNFTIDPVTSNRLSDDFYDLYYEAQYAKNPDTNNKVAEYQVKHLNRVKSSISELYEEKSKIQNSNLSNKEKLAQTRAIQILINEMYKTAIEDYDLITNAIKATSKVDDKYRYTEILHLVYGAETALKNYDEKVYEKSSLLEKSGVSYEVFYNYYFATRDIESDKDKNGNSISGSKKKKVIEAINKISTSKENKLLLIAISGYSFDEAADEAKLIKYINSLKLRASDKKKLAEMCGFEYKNGKIYASK